MDTAINFPSTSCALVIHDDGRCELLFPVRDDEDEVPKQELFLAAVAALSVDEGFVDSVIDKFLASRHG